MIIFYLIGFLLISAGIILLLGITPEVVTNDMMKFISPKQTLRDKAQIAKGRKKSRRITKEILHIKEALEVTGKGKQFTIACAASVVMLVAGCFLAVLLNNYFLIPVFAAAFAMLPFLFAKSTIAAYDKHIKEEMETALSIITTSYIRSDDIVGAVNENITYLKPPIREIFQGFVGDATMISSDLKEAIRNLKEKIDNDIYREWCDTLIACQDDRTLKDTLLPIVGKLTDVRIVNNDLKTMLAEVRKEYWMMVCMVVANIPLLYVLNKDWFHALMFTLPGKIVLAICALVILITALLMMKYTRPIEYKR
jgi:Flp pilus assembly protein TadB